jgi:NADP-reducing hydrogenase subunit HndB
MGPVKSLDDLERARGEALRQREALSAEQTAEIVVSMGTPAIAAGARETLSALVDELERLGLRGVTVRQTGDTGLDSWEPIVEVRTRGAEPVRYGRVTPDVAREIVRHHIAGGRVLLEYEVRP